jgi:hypothetical protein
MMYHDFGGSMQRYLNSDDSPLKAGPIAPRIHEPYVAMAQRPLLAARVGGIVKPKITRARLAYLFCRV